jgi:hypothetical protein
VADSYEAFAEIFVAEHDEILLLDGQTMILVGHGFPYFKTAEDIRREEFIMSAQECARRRPVA